MVSYFIIVIIIISVTFLYSNEREKDRVRIRKGEEGGRILEKQGEEKLQL